MAEPNLEDLARAAPQGNEYPSKKEEKGTGTLESVVKETGQFAKTAFNLGLAAAIPAMQAHYIPYVARDTAVVTGAQILGDATTNFKRGKKFTSTNVLESAVMGTALTIPTYHFFDLINKIPLNNTIDYFVKGVAWGGLGYPLYIGMYQFLDYITKNKKISGVFKYMKENYWTALKTAWKTVLPISLINIFFMPPYLQIPIGALLSYIVTLFGAPKKGEIPEEQKRDKTPYLVATVSALNKLTTNVAKNVFYGVPQAAYGMGNAVLDSLKKLYKGAEKAAAPKPSPAAAPVH